MAKANLEQIVSLKDERLNIDHIDQYRLSFFIDVHAIQVAIKDIKTNRLLLFEQHESDKSFGLIDNLTALHEEHILISAGFWGDIQVFFRNSRFALIPIPLFDKEQLYNYIRLNDQTDNKTDAYHFKQLDSYGLNFAFAYQAKVREWFKAKYPKVNLRFSHQGVAYLNYIQSELRPKAPASMYIDVKNNQALVVGMNFQKLAIYNQFTFKNAEHFIKLTALTCQQFSAERAKTAMILTGRKEELDTIRPTLKKYFPLVESGKRPINLQVHPVFNELEEYEYTEILANL